VLSVPRTYRRTTITPTITIEFRRPGAFFRSPIDDLWTAYVPLDWNGESLELEKGITKPRESYFLSNGVAKWTWIMHAVNSNTYVIHLDIEYTEQEGKNGVRKPVDVQVSVEDAG
jgi:hypothetical protein